MSKQKPTKLLPQNSGENRMGTMKESKLILKIAMPMVISMLVNALYNIVDSLFVAQISETQVELNAISLALAAQNLMIAVTAGTGVGINALISRALGEKNKDTVNKVATNGAFLAMLTYILFVVLGLTCIEPYMRLMTDNAEVIELGKQYLSICYLCSFGLCGILLMEKLVISTGKTHLAMLIQGTGAIINIILDPIFIFGFDMGIKGAAYATVIGQIIAFILGIILNRTFNKEIKLSFKKFRPSASIISKIYIIGVPSIIMMGIGSIMNVMFNGILNSFGAITGKFAQNAFGAYFKLQSFIFMPIFGLSNAMIPIVAYNYGARKKERLVKSSKLGMLYSMSYMAVGFVAFQLIPEPLAKLFITDPQGIEITVACLRVCSVAFVFAGYCIIGSAILQTLGNSVFSMISSIARQLVVLIPAAYFLSLTGDVNLVWWSFPIAEIMSVSITTICLIYVYKKKIAKIEPLIHPEMVNKL